MDKNVKCQTPGMILLMSTKEMTYKKKRYAVTETPGIIMSVFFFFISETTSVKEGERSWQPNTFFFALWTEIICLLFYSWQQKLDHKVSNMHINGLKG